MHCTVVLIVGFFHLICEATEECLVSALMDLHRAAKKLPKWVGESVPLFSWVGVAGEEEAAEPAALLSSRSRFCIEKN